MAKKVQVEKWKKISRLKFEKLQKVLSDEVNLCKGGERLIINYVDLDGKNRQVYAKYLSATVGAVEVVDLTLGRFFVITDTNLDGRLAS